MSHRRDWLVGALALLVFAFACLYRYNALGDTYGGFDGDHFHYYLRTQLVVHGERPLRDFVDHGLQGAWPSLTYEIPALAMRWGGETLLPEALLTVGITALSIAVLFVTAASLAGVGPALLAAVLTLSVSAKLYAYPKLIVAAVAAMLVVQYVRRPSRAVIVVMAVWSAIAFLYRHDLLLYAGSAMAVSVLASGLPSRRETVTRLALYAGVTLLLLLGPLYSIQHYVGLPAYLRSSLDVSTREAQRTDLPWPRFHVPEGGVAQFLADEQNAAAWLYYLCLAIPVLALIRLRHRPEGHGLDVRTTRTVVVTLVVFAALLNWFFLRGNLPGRFGDLGAPIALLGAWLLSTRVATSPATKAAVRGLATAALVATTLAADTLGSVRQELDTTGLSDGFEKIGRRLTTVTAELGHLPPPARLVSAAMPNIADYVRACTSPDDRVLYMAAAPEVLFMSSRRFAAGQPTMRPGYFNSTDEQERMLRRLRDQTVPIVVTEPEDVYVEDLAPEFPLIHAYVTSVYEQVGTLPWRDGRQMRILARRGLTPRATYGETNLPCFGET